MAPGSSMLMRQVRNTFLRSEAHNEAQLRMPHIEYHVTCVYEFDLNFCNAFML